MDSVFWELWMPIPNGPEIFPMKNTDTLSTISILKWLSINMACQKHLCPTMEHNLHQSCSGTSANQIASHMFKHLPITLNPMAKLNGLQTHSNVLCLKQRDREQQRRYYKHSFSVIGQHNSIVKNEMRAAETLTEQKLRITLDALHPKGQQK